MSSPIRTDIEVLDADHYDDCISVTESQSTEDGLENGCVIVCCVPGCTTTSIEDYSFYALLDISKLRLRKWKKLLRLEKVKNTDKVCGKHFDKDQFKISYYQGRQYLRLKNNAVPTAMSIEGKPKSPSAIRRDVRMRIKGGACNSNDDSAEKESPLTRSELLAELVTSPDTETTAIDLEKSNQLLQELVDRLTNFAFCQCSTCLSYYNRLVVHFDREHKHYTNDAIPVQASQETKEDFDYFDAFIEKVDSEIESEIYEESITEDVKVADDPRFEHEGAHTNLKEYHLGALPPSEVVNTSKQVFFKVEKSELGTFYSCTVCYKRMAYEEMAGHFKVHRKECEPSPVTVPKRLSQIEALYHRTEYQCEVCEELYLMRSLAHECAQSHSPEDLPSHEEDDDRQSLIPSNEMDTAGEVEISQESELEERQQGHLGSEAQQQLMDKLPSQRGSLFNCHTCDWAGVDINYHLKTVHGKKFKVLRADEAKLRYVIQCSSLQCRTKANQKLEFRNLQEGVAHRRAVHAKLVDYGSTKNLTRILVHPDLTETIVLGDFLTFASNLLVRGYVCVCNCVFSQKNDAERCLAKHLGVKKFRCQYAASDGTHSCKLLFYTSADLEQHRKKVHLNPDKSEGICEICGKEVLKRRMRQHTRSHRRQVASFECPICHKSYAGQYRLWRHVQVIHKKNEKNKIYTCSICKSRYVHRNDAVLCKAKHAEVKSQTCNKCNERFSTKSEKAKHTYKCHNKADSNGDSTQIEVDS